MRLEFSPLIIGKPMNLNAGFSAASLDFSAQESFANPVLHMDHFRMGSVTFAPHPHAGFSAISYILRDSPGSIRNRDSLGNDFVVGAGGIVWTQAGPGVVHDELPDVVGVTVHGLQIFINLSGANKPHPPQVFHRNDTDLPRVRVDSGATVKVVVGTFADAASPLVPAEPVDFLDIDLSGAVTIPLAGDRQGIIYVAGGSARVDADRYKGDLKQEQALAFRGEGDIALIPHGPDTTVTLISAPALREPVFKHGPFVMNDRGALEDAVMRYQQGQMGNLAPLAASTADPP